MIRVDIWGTDVRLVVWRLPGSRSGSSMSTLVYSRLAAFSLSQVSQFCFGKKSLRTISLGIAYILYIVTRVNFICSLTKSGTLVPRSTIYQKIIFVKWIRGQNVSSYGQKPVRNLRANS